MEKIYYCFNSYLSFQWFAKKDLFLGRSLVRCLCDLGTEFVWLPLFDWFIYYWNYVIPFKNDPWLVCFITSDSAHLYDHDWLLWHAFNIISSTCKQILNANLTLTVSQPEIQTIKSLFTSQELKLVKLTSESFLYIYEHILLFNSL